MLLYGSAKKELSAGYRLTTNNRMEVLAVIKGLEALKEPCRVNLYSDSKYVVDAIEKGWVVKWRQNGWMRNKKEKASNVDLWERLLLLLEKHQVTFLWAVSYTHLPEILPRGNPVHMVRTAGRHYLRKPSGIEPRTLRPVYLSLL